MAPPTFAPGHDLVGRYRILEVLGVGHVAEVYRAEDLSLRRDVVVKVLLGPLAAHEDVRRAFRDRIVRAATLSHPHLERVYDGGQEGGHIFMITEFLTGGSLEGFLADGRRLDVDATARLGRDVAGALAYLHANGFVHGSLSPNCLLFDAEGRVRVSDVALSGLGGMHGEPLTYDEVRYLSPEQSLGEDAVERSDVYALALILFEAVTGASPFEAMTPEAMLRTRATSALPVRPELGTLDMVLAQAAVPDPRQRVDAEQFANRLGATASDAAPLVLAPRRDDVPLLAQFAPSEPRTSIGFRPPSPEQIVGVSSQGRHGAPPRDPRLGRGAYEALAPTRPSRRRRVVLAATAAVIVVAAALGGAAWKLGWLSTHETVPSLVGLSVTEASNLLKSENYGFVLNIAHHTHSATVPADDIVSQSPPAGTVGKSGLSITVTVSDGPTMVAVPTGLVGEDCASATAALLKVHLSAQCPSSAATYSDTVPAGRVVRVRLGTTINPTSVPLGSTLSLVLSLGPSSTTTTSTPGGTTTSTTATTTTTTAAATVAVPNLVGMNQAQVKAAMTAAGLYYTTRGPGSGANPTWTKVVSTSPAAGTVVKKLSTVIVNVQ